MASLRLLPYQSNDYASRSPASLSSLGSSDVASIPDEVDQSPHALHCSSPLPPTPKVIFGAPFSPQHAYSQEIFASGDVIDCEASPSATYNPELLINGPPLHFSPPPTPHSALHFIARDVAQFSSTHGALMVETPCSAANSAIERRPETFAPPTHDDSYISDDWRVAWKTFVDDMHIFPSNVPPPSPYEELEWLTSIPENAGADFRVQTAAQFHVLDAGDTPLCDTDTMTTQGSLDSRIITCPRTPLALSNPVINLHLQQTGSSDCDSSTLHLYALNDKAGKKNECNRDVCAVSIDDRDVLHLPGSSEGLEVTHKYEQNGILADDNALISSPDSFRTPSPRLVPRYQGISEQGIHFRATAHIPWSPERMTGLECDFRVLGRENRYSERSVSNARQSSEEADAQPNWTAWESPVLNNIDLTKHCAQRDASPHREIAVRDNQDKPPSTNHSTDTFPLECPPTNAPIQADDDIPPLRTTPCLHSADCCPLIGATASDSINNGESGSMSPVPEGGGGGGKRSGAYSVCDGAVSLGVGQILGPDLFGSDQNEHDEDS